MWSRWKHVARRKPLPHIVPIEGMDQGTQLIVIEGLRQQVAAIGTKITEAGRAASHHYDVAFKAQQDAQRHREWMHAQRAQETKLTEQREALKRTLFELGDRP